MSRRFGKLFVGVLLLAATAALAQEPRRSVLYTRPVEPPREALERLNLALQWKANLPTDGLEDGLAMVQVAEEEVFVQLRSGVLVVLDKATGETRWQYQLPRRYTTVFRVGTNSKSVFVVNATHIYAMERKRGRLEFTVDLPTTPSSGPIADEEAFYVCLGSNRLSAWLIPPPIAPAPVPLPSGQPIDIPIQGPKVAPLQPPGNVPPGAPLRPAPLSPTAPEMQYRPPVQLQPTNAEQSLGNRQYTPSITVLPTLRPPYQLDVGSRSPSITVLPTLRPPYRLEPGSRSPSLAMVPTVTQLARLSDLSARGPEAKRLWDYVANYRMEQQPIQTREYVLTATTSNVVLANAKEFNKLVYEFPADAPISAFLSQYGETAYVPTTDAHLYALNIPSGRVTWRFTGGGTLDRKPLVTDDSVFAGGGRSGLTRIDRLTGEQVWRNGLAGRVGAVNPKFVYGFDPQGRLQVIDRARGSILSTLDTRDFVVPILNERDDRLFLAANNGLILCLRDRDYRAPVLLRKGEAIAPIPKKKGGKEGPPKKEPVEMKEPPVKKEPPKKGPPPKVKE